MIREIDPALLPSSLHGSRGELLFPASWQHFIQGSVAMKAIHPDIDTAVFYAVTVFCAMLMLAL
ncbi:MAG: hypothetical protein WAO76_11715 [Georgfuchsia sp.]